MPICDDELQIIYRQGHPKGIRDKGGFILFFPEIQRYEGQKGRYQKEVSQQFDLADYILTILEATQLDDGGHHE